MEPHHTGVDLARSIVRHCAPTLAALKPASLFTCKDASNPRLGTASARLASPEAFERLFAGELAACRRALAPCGVRIEVLARRTTGVLLYVYRPALLASALADARVSAYLDRTGYDLASLDAGIERLRRRVRRSDARSRLAGTCAFPHEIGFFLGYPYDDVVGFIENEGRNSLCGGCWKVYARQRDAEECFCCYKRCTAAYESLFAEGVPLECLASVDENFPAAEAYRAAG